MSALGNAERQMADLSPEEQAEKAIRHVLQRVINDGRINYLIGPGSHAFDLLTEAYASITRADLGQVRLDASRRAHEERMDADARLIAAAPDLLEALRVAERCIKGYTESSRRECGLDGIRAAIAKATGGAA